MQCHWGELGWTRNLDKRLEGRDQDETWWEKLVGEPEACTNLIDNSRFPDSTIWGAGGRGKIEKIEIILTYERGDRILMKFDIKKNLVSESSYFKSRTYDIDIGGVGGGNRL